MLTRAADLGTGGTDVDALDTLYKAFSTCGRTSLFRTWVRTARELTMILENNMSDKQVKVKVIDRWRVVYDDKPFVKGETVTVPESVAAEWGRSGYVERPTRKT